tara:strand:+ start:1443 stop:1691 length:249 start_codon:yes stop_codon:yes gene_type:complete
MLDENCNLKYQLETLASYEPGDIDNPEFEVIYESDSGGSGCIDICCIELAQRSLARIVELENAISVALEYLEKPHHTNRGID